jgi:putative membrane protein
MPFCGWTAFGSASWMSAWPFLVLWFALKVAMWALVVTAVVLAIRWLRGHGTPAATPTPLGILQARYARGEITRQDFESMRRDLEA